MRNSAYSLRDMEEKDLERVLAWRNSDRIRVNMYRDHIISIEDHLAWFQKTMRDKAEVYKIFEHRLEPLGLVSFTHYDAYNNKCFWGFYIGEPNAPAGAGAIMGFLGLEVAFEMLNLRKICGEAFAFNSASIRFHQKLGFRQEGVFISEQLKGGSYEDVIRFAILKEEWMQNKKNLERILFGKGEV